MSDNNENDTILNDDSHKSSFKQRVVLEVVGKYTWILYEDFEYYRSDNPDEIIRIPKGTITDLATVPRWLWLIVPPLGKYTKASIIHDYLYQNAINTKEYADKVFLEAMEVAGVKLWRRKIMYWSVKAFGRGKYLEHKKASKLFKLGSRINRLYKIYKQLGFIKSMWSAVRCIPRVLSFLK